MNRLGTKADTLEMLYRNQERFSVWGGVKILPQYTFTVAEWKEDFQKVEQAFLELTWNDAVIVRSSSLAEDTSENSQAGKYESIAGVSGAEEFRAAVEAVIASYDDAKEENQVLVQPMLTGVCVCGVAFTLDPNTLGNYYVINYDDSGSTSSITSGEGSSNKLFYRFKECSPKDAEGQPEVINRLCLALQGLEEFFGQDKLDVEFAVTDKDELFILQVRALCVRQESADIKRQKRELERIRNKIEHAQTKKPFLCGDKTVYSVMTD